MRLSPRFWNVAVVLIIIFPIFGRLDALPIQLWDESRLAINAFELYKTKHWMIPTYNWEPDTWNTKPPLLIWIQVIFFKLFGVSELSLRLPSAFAGVATCITLYSFFAIKFKKHALGFLAVLILITSSGFIKYHHSVRTGDYDALLTFFTTLYPILFFLYLDENKRSYLLGTLIVLTLAVMTKSTAGLLFLPALFIYVIYKKKLIDTLKAPQLYIGIGFFLAIVVGYYLLREHYMPGYLKLVMGNDVVGRFASSDRAIVSLPLHYYNLIKDIHFNYWYFWALAGIVLGIFSTEGRIKDITILSSLLVLVLFFVLSNGVNKSDWYDMPLYPFLSILATVGIWKVYNVLSNINTNQFVKKEAIGFAFLLVVCVPPYIMSIYKYLNLDPGEWIAYNTDMCFYLKDEKSKDKPERNITIVTDNEYFANIEWYIDVLKDKNVDAKMIHYQDIGNQQKVMAFQQQVKKYITSTYNYRVVGQPNTSVVIYQLNGKKISAPVYRKLSQPYTYF